MYKPNNYEKAIIVVFGEKRKKRAQTMKRLYKENLFHGFYPFFDEFYTLFMCGFTPNFGHHDSRVG